MKITGEEARNIVNGDTDEWEDISGAEVIDTSRWSNHYQQVFEHKETEKFYVFYYSRGATESQDEQPYEYDNEVDLQEVVEKEVIKKVWVKVGNEK